MSRASRGISITVLEFLQFSEDNFNITPTNGWIDGFLKRRASQFRRMILVPQDLTRMQVGRSDFDHYIALTKMYVPLVPAELIFNMDESGLSDWEEWRPKRVLVPSNANDEGLHHPVD
jgi:hypothetical protein